MKLQMGIDDVHINPEDLSISAQKSQPPSKVDPYSKVILILFCLSEIAVSIQFMTCAPIAVPLSHSYGTDALLIGSTATLQMFLYPVLTIPSTMVMNRYGVATTIKLGSVLVLAGSLVRCLTIVTHEFFWVIVGSFIIGVGRPFVINMQGDLTSTWFLPESRTKVMSLFNFLVTVSLVTGTVLASLMFYGYNKDAHDAKENGRKRFNLLLMIELGVSLLAYVPTITLFRKKIVKNPPVHEHFLVQGKLLFRNIRYIIVFLGFSLCFGTFKGFGVSLPFMINYYGFEPSDNAPLAIAPILGGILSSMMVAKAFKKAGRYKPLVVGVQIITTGLLLLLFPCIASEKVWVMSILSLFLGFFIMPSVPLLIEWGCKVAYPVSDAFAIGILYSGATLGGALLGEIQIKMVKGKEADRNSILTTIIFMASTYALALVLTCFNRETRAPKVEALEPIYVPIEEEKHQIRAYTVSNSIDVVNYIHVDHHETTAAVYDFEKESTENTTQEAPIQTD